MHAPWLSEPVQCSIALQLQQDATVLVLQLLTFFSFLSLLSFSFGFFSLGSFSYSCNSSQLLSQAVPFCMA
jgi:hypothetical protein